MPHKNVRAFDQLQDMGGDVEAARQAFGATQATLAANKAIEKVVEYPDGKESNSSRTPTQRDRIRAAKLAIHVRKLQGEEATQQWQQPTQQEAAALSDDVLIAIVLRALPARPARDIAPLCHTARGAAAITGAKIQIELQMDTWDTYVTKAMQVANDPTMKRIFSQVRMETILGSLHNTRTLIEEVKKLGGILNPINKDSRVTTITDTGTNTLQGVAIWSTGKTSQSLTAETYAHLDNIVAHPSGRLPLEPKEQPIKGAGTALIGEVEKQARTDGCTSLLLDAGTADLLPFYAGLGFSVLLMPGVDADATAAAAAAALAGKRDLAQAKKLVMQRMGKVL